MKNKRRKSHKDSTAAHTSFPHQPNHTEPREHEIIVCLTVELQCISIGVSGNFFGVDLDL